ncbi:MAG: glycosyltransferase family 2 protein, partial [Rhodothermaceae bacterium]|nr:glycosyltransferase family 2 protein [Rhodothermaceae bacterium]
MRTPRVAVIIVSYNALPILQKCLPTVVRTTWPNLEIVFADNNSTDGSSEWIA